MLPELPNPGPDLYTPQRPWLPTTRTQSVLVYALNVLLLFNLTVIVVMLSGATPAKQHEPNLSASSPDQQALVDQTRIEQAAPLQSGVSAATEAPPIETPAQPDPVQADPPLAIDTQPLVLVDPPAAHGDAGTALPTMPAEKPVELFGVGLE